MKLYAIILVILSQLLVVVGEIFLKHAMSHSRTRIKVARSLALGVFCLAMWFFIWLGLLADLDLSRLFPFQGLTPALVVLGAWLWLDERLPKSSWVAMGLITVGLVLVAADQPVVPAGWIDSLRSLLHANPWH